MRPLDPTAPYGGWQLNVSGTVNTIGGGIGGTSMVDDNPFTPGGTSITPAGGYYGGRTIGSGHAAAPALSGSAILQVEVVGGGAGGGVAQNQMRGTAGNWVDIGVASGAAGAAGNWAMPVIQASGQVFTVNIGAGGGGFASAAVYGSPANPVYVVGTVDVRPLSTFTVALDKIPTVNLGLGTVNVGNVVSVAGGGFASVAVYGSPANPVYIVGTVDVRPLTTFTVSLDKIPTINLGLGTVNVGNIPTVNVGNQVNVTASIPGVPVVDTRGSLVPTTWPIAFAGSGYFAIAVSSLAGGQRTKLYAIHVTTEVSAVLSFQSPSGTWLTGSIRVPGAAGFNMGPGQLGHPVLIGGSNATLFLHIIGSQNVGGWVAGWVEAG